MLICSFLSYFVVLVFRIDVSLLKDSGGGKIMLVFETSNQPAAYLHQN